MDFLFEGEGLEFLNTIRYPTFKISPKKITFIIGPSGVGKSVLLKMLNLTVNPSAGILRYRRKLLTEYQPISLRREVMLISQDTFLFPGNIRDNFHLFYEYRELPAPEDEQIERWLSICMLKLPIYSDCSLLSGGERQRVMLAIYLSLSPSVLLLDEPTSALDYSTAEALFKNVVSYANEKGISIIAVSHTPELIDSFAQDKIFLERDETTWVRKV